MYVLLGMHLLAFLSKLQIYKIEMPKFKNDKDDEFVKVEADATPGQLEVPPSKEEKLGDAKRRGSFMPSDMIKTIKFEDHYKEMKRRFDISCNWVWVIHSMAVVGCFIAFLIIPGKELVYSLYIPLDTLFGVGKAAFFWYNYWIDKQRKDDKKRLKEKLSSMEQRKHQLEE